MGDNPEIRRQPCNGSKSSDWGSNARMNGRVFQGGIKEIFVIEFATNFESIALDVARNAGFRHQQEFFDKT